MLAAELHGVFTFHGIFDRSKDLKGATLLRLALGPTFVVGAEERKESCRGPRPQVGEDALERPKPQRAVTACGSDCERLRGMQRNAVHVCEMRTPNR
eukprot:scaffold576_cov260-Pinguiococcus_pyrenoidosus.AAC.77